MKNRAVSLLLVVLSVLLLVSCRSAPPPLTTAWPFEEITMENVQYNGWRNMVFGGQYVFSSDGLGTLGMGKLDLLTNGISEVCLRPDCNHGFPGQILFDPNYCRVSAISEPLFVVEREIFYTYHVFEEVKEKTESGAENNADEIEESRMDVIYIFASYNFITGESRDILQIRTTEFEQMYKFSYSNGYIYYCRNIAKVDNPEKKEDYQLSCCRMKIGEYNEEILFAFEEVCSLPEGVLPDPIATENGKIYFTCVESGRLLEVDMESRCARFYLGEGDVSFGTFDSPGAFYVDGYIYFTAVSPELAGTDAEMFVVELHRVNCATGQTEKLTEDLVRWFFVTDKHIYYGMAHDIQPTEAQLEEAGDNLSVHTVKRIDHNGKNECSYKMRLPSPDIALLDVVGIGESLYFRASYFNSEGSTQEFFKVVFCLKDGTVSEIGRKESDSAENKPT